jgi:hypothetical protein
MLVDFDPRRLREDLAEIERRKNAAIKRKDRELIEQLATLYVLRIAQAVDYYNANVQTYEKWLSQYTPETIARLEEEIGFSAQTIWEWKQHVERGDYAEWLLTKLLKAADIIETPKRKQPKRKQPVKRPTAPTIPPGARLAWTKFAMTKGKRAHGDPPRQVDGG